MDLGPLLAGLQRRGGTPYVLSDVAPLGANILQSVQQAVAAADRVLVVLADETASLNSVFEAGMAAALGKPIVIVADPQLRIPTDLAGFLTVRARPDDLVARQP
jgi:nucleoside 2-deoxyribosyltransferase